MSKSDGIALIAYGSLMSGHGLAPLGRLHATRAARVALHNVRRGFAKHSQRGNRLAMALDPIRDGVAIEARVLAADDPVGTAPEGLLLEVSPAALRLISLREAYDPNALGQLQQAAAAHGLSLPEYLWVQLADAGFDTANYRARLFAQVGYTSPHYVPHPVALGDGQRALTFLAPGGEGSGPSRVVPVRVRTGNGPLLSAAAAWRDRPNETQLAYLTTCFLGAQHGICLRDLVDDADADNQLDALLRASLQRDGLAEMQRFLAATGLGADTYRWQLGDPASLPARSGLSHLLRAQPIGD
jgi:hypothetical protein